MFKSKLILLLVITFSLTSCLGGGSSGDENPTNQTDDGGSDDDSGNQSETGDQATTVEGELTKDTIWSGVVEAGYVVVPEGVTLTIQPWLRSQNEKN